MNTTFKNILVGMGIAAVAIFGYLAFFHKELGNQFGSIAVPTQPNAESATIAGYFSESMGTAGVIYLAGHNTDTYNIAQYGQAGACSIGTTTLFSSLNPYSATSSVRLVSLYGVNGTSTIKLLVGTSTINTVAGSLAGPALINITSLATSSNFYTSSDSIAGPAGYINPGTTNTSIVVGPSEYLVIQATSTTGTSVDNAALTQTGSKFSCTYKLIWTR